MDPYPSNNTIYVEKNLVFVKLLTYKVIITLINLSLDSEIDEQTLNLCQAI